MTRASRLPLALAFSALAALSGCLSADGGPDVARSDIEVTASAVRIAGPAGFCVDPQQTSTAPDRAFVVMGSCAAIADRATMAQPDLPVVLTAAVSRGRIASPTALAAYFMASRARHASPFTVLEVARKDDVVLLHVRDTRIASDWRCILVVEPDVTITLALRAGSDATLTSDQRRRMIEAFAARIVQANSGRIVATRGA